MQQGRTGGTDPDELPGRKTRSSLSIRAVNTSSLPTLDSHQINQTWSESLIVMLLRRIKDFSEQKGVDTEEIFICK